MTRLLMFACIVVVTCHSLAQAPDKPTTTPTPPDKVAALQPLPTSISGSQRFWSYRSNMEDGHSGILAGVAEGIVTLREGTSYIDLAIDQLSPLDQASAQRVARLLQGKELGDERALLGSWGELPEMPDSPARRFRRKVYINACGISGQMEVVAYSLDPTKTPKEIDFDERKGIYELNGDELKLCVGPKNGARPTAFTDAGEQTSKSYRRLPDAQKLPLLGADDLEPELKTRLEELSRLLEAKKYAEFVDQAFSAKMNDEQKTEVTEFITSQEPRQLILLQAELRVKPKKRSPTEYYYNFSDYHVDGGDYGNVASLVKIDGRWYFKY